MYFCAAPSSENDHGSMNLDFEYGSGPLDHAVQSSSQKSDHRMLHPALDRGDHLARVALEPMPVEGFGHDSELDGQIARKILGFRFAALLAPQADEGGFVLAHDDAGIRAAEKLTPVRIPGFRGISKHCRVPMLLMRETVRGTEHVR